MTDKQPDALRLAQWADSFNTTTHDQAAAGLRRLHALNAELVEALRDMLDYAPDPAAYSTACVHERARAALSKAEAQQ
jgi:hypothetical protein